MNAQTNLPATQRDLPPITKLNTQLEQRADEFRKALPSHITPEKLQRTIMTAAQNNPDLLTADRQSLITSAMKAAQDGLLPDGREAALVIFNVREKGEDGQWYSRKVCQYMPMVYGLRKKIVQSGDVVSLQTGLVYRAEMEAQAFLYEIGLEPPIRHRPMLDLPAEELTDDKIVAAYSIAKMKDGTVSVEVMRRGEIDKVRESSQTGATKDRFGKDRTPKGPWVDWFGEMARKTVMRRHSKTLPMSGDIIVDVEGREYDATTSAARLLQVEPDAPISLPGSDDLDEQIDQDTGEVTQTDSRGMTEVDEDAARALDAGDQGDEEQAEAEQEPQRPAKGKGADATYFGQKPETASHGETWFNPADNKLRYAHQTQNGIKWYADAPKPKDEPSEQSQAAEQTVQDIDGTDEVQEQNDEPAYAATVRQIKQGIADAGSMAILSSVETVFLNHAAGLPDDVSAEIEQLLLAKKRAIRAGENLAAG